ncbi:YhgE/Pip family protein, partial [Microvirga sp. 3-52]|nr:YhgE/Pip family protein [Microvirga sp. 3-52]
MIKAEWKQLLRTKKLAVPMIAILFIPVLYAGMFLWAFWDPYENMNDLPVAIVNSDVGAEMDGEQLKLGKDLSKTLIDDQTFKFSNATKEEAEKGLKNQDYYVVIEIP